MFPEEILEEGKKHFGTSNVEHEIKTYSGVPHGKRDSVLSTMALFTHHASLLDHGMTNKKSALIGFAVYGDYDSASIKKSQAEAFEQILSWLQSH